MARYRRVTKEKTLDSTIDLIREGYLFIKNRVEQHQSNYFETRLMGQKTVCMSGEEAARLFYNPELFQRQGAIPGRIQKTAFGVGAIQTLDGEEHLHRKRLFTSLLMAPVKQKYLADLAMEGWLSLIIRWEAAERIVLLNEAKDLLCRIACQWAGVPLTEGEISQRADDFSIMINTFGAVGPRYWKARAVRIRTEMWLRELVENARAGTMEVDQESALYAMARHRDFNGNLLDARTAAIELINFIRPMIAISNFITFSALALCEHPRCKEQLISGNNWELEAFAQEVRRYYPFAPFLGARVRKDFVWNGYEFQEGMLVLLDIYGTNHDPQLWEDPDEFQPGRFKSRKNRQFDFIPQGGGDPTQGHRCPGEGITVEIIKTSADFLVNHIRYQVPKQDLSYSRVRIPTWPASGFIMKNIRSK
ncbi:MAG: cytochrome P450 [Methylocystaceae bacterium]